MSEFPLPRPLLAFLVGLFCLTGCSDKLPLHRPSTERSVWRGVATGGEVVEAPKSQNPRVALETSMGRIVIELFPEAAPLSVENFLRYVDSGHYEGVLFHRVIAGFMIQTGGYDYVLLEKETNAPVKNEAGNGLRNVRGAVALARTQDPDSATSQFFINVADNAFLDGDGPKTGYAVFGRVVEGMPVVDQIALVETATRNGMDNVPVKSVELLSVQRLKP